MVAAETSVSPGVLATQIPLLDQWVGSRQAQTENRRQSVIQGTQPRCELRRSRSPRCLDQRIFSPLLSS